MATDLAGVVLATVVTDNWTTADNLTSSVSWDLFRNWSAQMQGITDGWDAEAVSVGMDNISSISVGHPGEVENAQPVRHLSLFGQTLITSFYVFGASANICSLILLTHTNSTRNRKLSLMVRCLAGNDLLALSSSFLLMYMQLYLKPDLVTSRWFCGLRVLTRLFGFSSGSVASVMAVERWIALTRPFVYQKHITYKLIKRAIFTLWFLVLGLVFLPLIGFGLYYDPINDDRRHICARYRYATSPEDVAYAYLVFTFGTMMCAVIVCCNLAVVKVLCRMGPESVARRTTVSRDSRELAFNHTTPEELSFAKLMVILCVFFVACWLPQMVTIIIAQSNPKVRDHPFYRVADVCTALNFILDPVVYVLSRRPHRRGLRRLLKPICHVCWSQQDNSSSGRSNSQARTVSRSNRCQYGQMIQKESDDEYDASSQKALAKNGKSHHLFVEEKSKTPSLVGLSSTGDEGSHRSQGGILFEVNSVNVNAELQRNQKISYYTSV